MNKLKIRIKVDITGPMNWTKDVTIDYNDETILTASSLVANYKPLDFNIGQIEASIRNIAWLLETISSLGFKTIE